MTNLKKYPISVLSPKGLSAVSIGQPFNNAKSGLFIMKEIWKDIPEYKGCYQASNFGKIKSITRDVYYCSGSIRIHEGKILSSHVTSLGYLRLHLSMYGKAKNLFVHRLVAQAFLANPNNKPYINHINNIIHDNRIENLEWCTQKENIAHAIQNGYINNCGEDSSLSKLTNRQAKAIRKKYVPYKHTAKKLSTKYNVSVAIINNILQNRTYQTMLEL